MCLCKGNSMKRKQLIAVSIFSICLFTSACGSNTTDTETIAIMQNTETQQAEIETENISTELVEESLSEPTEQIEVTEPTTDTSTSEYLSESDEIAHSKWADINGAWDAEHQYTLYAKSQGADYTMGWCWIYEHGKAAGDQPSYAVYMKEGDPLYGTVYHVGDYLPIGTQFSGTNDEWEGFIAEDMIRQAQEEGLEVTEEDGAYVIHLD